MTLIPPAQSSSSAINVRSLQLYDDVHFEPGQLVDLFKSAIKVDLFHKNREKFNRLVTQITSSAAQFPAYQLRKISMIAAKRMVHDVVNHIGKFDSEEQEVLQDLLGKTIRIRDAIEILRMGIECVEGFILIECGQCIDNFTGASLNFDEGTWEVTYAYRDETDYLPEDWDERFFCTVEIKDVKEGMKEYLRELRSSHKAIRIVYTVEENCSFEDAKLMTENYGDLIDHLRFENPHESIQDEGKVEILIRNCSKLKHLVLDRMNLQKLQLDPSHSGHLRFLEFWECYNLESLPSNLPHLLILNLKKCPRVTRLPSSLVNLQNLKIEGLTKWATFLLLTKNSLPESINRNNLLQFHFRDPTFCPPALILNPLVWPSIWPLLEGMDVEESKKATYFDYLLHESSGHEKIVSNLQQMEREGKLEAFQQANPPSPTSADCLRQDYALLPSYELLHRFLKSPNAVDHEKVEELLQKEVGKNFVTENMDKFLTNPHLYRYLFIAFPPDSPENMARYFKTRVEGDKLFIETIPRFPLDYPDAVFHAIRQPLATVKELHVTYFGTKEGYTIGYSKQFYSQFFQGLVSQSTIFRFQKRTNGTLIPAPKIAQQPSVEERSNYVVIGRLIGIGLRMRWPIGEFFNHALFFMILSLNHSQLNDEQFTAETFFKLKNFVELFGFIDPNKDFSESGFFDQLVDMENPHLSLAYQKTKGLWTLEDDEFESVKAELTGLLNLEETHLKKQLIRAVEHSWIEMVKGQFEIAHSIARGIRELLPYPLISRRKINTWKELRSIKVIDFSQAIQGVLTKEVLIQNLAFTAEYELSGGVSEEQKAQDRSKLDQVKEWMVAWINQASEQQIRNIVQALAGAPSLSQRINCNLTPNIQDGYIRVFTCTNYLEILRDVTEEQFVGALDDFGNHKHLAFTQ